VGGFEEMGEVKRITLAPLKDTEEKKRTTKTLGEGKVAAFGANSLWYPSTNTHA